MLSEERIMEIAECCPVWYAIPQGREKALLTKFARAIEREAYKQGQERMRERAASQAQETVNDEVSLDKFATLEAELSGLRARYLRMESEDAATIAQQAERIEELSFDAAMANQAREIGNHFGLTYMQLWSDTSIASQVIDKMKEQQATIAQQAEQLAAAEKVIDTAGNLIAQEGRHNTEIAYKRLAKAIAEQKEGK